MYFRWDNEEKVPKSTLWPGPCATSLLQYGKCYHNLWKLLLFFSFKNTLQTQWMALNGLLCADVPLRNYSLTTLCSELATNNPTQWWHWHRSRYFSQQVVFRNAINVISCLETIKTFGCLMNEFELHQVSFFLNSTTHKPVIIVSLVACIPVAYLCYDSVWDPRFILIFWTLLICLSGCDNSCLKTWSTPKIFLVLWEILGFIVSCNLIYLFV